MTLKGIIIILVLTILAGLDQWELRRRLRKSHADGQTIRFKSLESLTGMLMTSTLIVIIVSHGLSMLSVIFTTATFIAAIWTLYVGNKIESKKYSWNVFRMIAVTLLANIGGWYMETLWHHS